MKFFQATLGQAGDDPVLDDLRDATGARLEETKAATKCNSPTPLRYHRCERAPVHGWLWSGLMTPVVHHQLGAQLAALCPSDVELVPVLLGDQTTPEYAVLNILASPDCIDESRSLTEPALASDLERWPHTVRYKGVSRLMVDPRRVAPHHVIRPRYWTGAVVMSEAAVRSIRDAAGPGLSFIPAS